MGHLLRAALVAVLASLALAGTAQAGGGRYVFDGGTAHEHAQVRAALNASAFDWDLVREEITIHIGNVGGSRSRRGEIWLDSELLDAGRFSWAIVQDEYSHQIDYFLFTPQIRARLTKELGAKDWCYGVQSLRHSDYGCERFSSVLPWAYWPSIDNSYKPRSKQDESAAMAPARFRALMTELIGAQSVSFVTIQ
jgi:hypothetical protein